jgi:chromosome partitioning protein
MSERERKLQLALTEIRTSFDFILLDCPPAVGLLTVNALTAADGVLVPIQCEYYALEGLSQLLSTIDLVRDNLNPRLKLAGVLLTMFDGRTTLSADVAAEVRRHLGDLVFRTVVPRSVRLAEAPSYGRPIARYSPESRGAQAYKALADEVLERAPQQVLSA